MCIRDRLDTYYDELGKTLGEALIAPTVMYVKAIQSVLNSGVAIHGCSHNTGGGFYENVPRMLPENVDAVVLKDSYEVPAIFKLLAKKGNIAEEMMYNTYNMGIGMMLAVDSAEMCIRDRIRSLQILLIRKKPIHPVKSQGNPRKNLTITRIKQLHLSFLRSLKNLFLHLTELNLVEQRTVREHLP